jgi:hypothetical protein
VGYWFDARLGSNDHRQFLEQIFHVSWPHLIDTKLTFVVEQAQMVAPVLVHLELVLQLLQLNNSELKRARRRLWLCRW